MKARTIAADTLADVRTAMGVGPPGDTNVGVRG